jgi:hypothetical protein
MPHGFTRNVSAFIDDVEDDYDTNDDDLATADATTDGRPRCLVSSQRMAGREAAPACVSSADDDDDVRQLTWLTEDALSASSARCHAAADAGYCCCYTTLTHTPQCKTVLRGSLSDSWRWLACVVFGSLPIDAGSVSVSSSSSTS